MEKIRQYCGLVLAKHNDKYYCVDAYEQKIKKAGTFDECNNYFNSIVNKIINK